MSISNNSTNISIHAPHEGERQMYGAFGTRSRRFQSTLPTRGSDHGEVAAEYSTLVFQSTLPTRGSDYSVDVSGTQQIISIHAPHEGERPN